MSIKIRLLLLTATGLLAALFMGLDSLFNNARTADAVNDNQVSLTALRNHLEADMMHDALRADAFSALLVGLGKSPSSADEVRSSLQEHAARFRKVLEANQQLPTSAAIKQALEQVQPNLNAYLAAAEQIVSQSLQDPELGQKALPSFNNAFEQLEGDMEALSGLIEENAHQSSDETNSAISAANKAIIAALLVSLLLLTAQGIWIVSSIMRPLRFANRIATATAAGNLSEYIEQPTSQDEASTLVRSLASMQRDLREMIELITTKARGVSAITQRLSSGCHSVAISSQQQTDGANTMAAAANQMNASIEEITRHAEQARQMANQAEHLAKDGGLVIHQVVKDMDAIAHSVQASAQVIRTLDQESEQIFSIIQVIKGIADQTNLLALNAAIEAARAGEQGRGFAVVADEVRQLAGRTSASTEEIASMVQRIQSSTREAVTSMEAGVTQVDKGMTVTADVERAIREILEATLSTTRLVDDISRTIGEQSLASHEIAQQVENIANMSHDNSQVIEQTARTTDELARLADELGHSVDRFRLS
ncbi:MAG: methyl-accepting chemotaxis protein [Pseudomonadales bacterium]|nr:methyl-accepting chemotaxis protein [Pseudomonadales bacterium]